MSSLICSRDAASCALFNRHGAPGMEAQPLGGLMGDGTSQRSTDDYLSAGQGSESLKSGLRVRMTGF